MEASKEKKAAEYFAKKGWTAISQPSETSPLDLNLGAHGDWIYSVLAAGVRDWF